MSKTIDDKSHTRNSHLVKEVNLKLVPINLQLIKIQSENSCPLRSSLVNILFLYSIYHSSISEVLTHDADR
jgi:hypothetical protein